MHRQSLSAFLHGGHRFRAASWWPAVLDAADGTAGPVSAAETPRRDAFQRSTAAPFARASHRPRLN